MQPKFEQSNETRYENNEYENMPSVGYLLYQSDRLTTKNQKFVDWDLIDEIVKKYGFQYAIINDTFCSYGEWGVFASEFVLYYKTDLDYNFIDSLRKKKQYDVVKKFKELYKDIPQRLHDCVHELDEQTPLLFATGWAGNCGYFGSYDVNRNTYSFGDSIYTWTDIEDQWDFGIHDTTKKLKRGVYFFMTSNHIKDENKQA